MTVRGALSGLGAGVAMIALLAAITLTASPRRSELAGFEPWQVAFVSTWVDSTAKLERPDGNWIVAGDALGQPCQSGYGRARPGLVSTTRVTRVPLEAPLCARLNPFMRDRVRIMIGTESNILFHYTSILRLISDCNLLRFDQPGSFAGGGYAGAIAGRHVPGMMLTQDAAFEPWQVVCVFIRTDSAATECDLMTTGLWQETPWSGRATQGLDAQGQDW